MRPIMGFGLFPYS